jgi:acetyl-CoA synthetase
MSGVVDQYAALHAGFRWRVPKHFNIAEVCCARWARGRAGSVAIRCECEDGRVTTHTYAELQRDANRVANALKRLGVRRGDRVAIVMPQRFETAVAHVAIYQLGAVATPLSMLFGPDALEYRLNDSAARVAIVDETAIANVRAARPLCADLTALIAVGTARGQGDLDWGQALRAERATATVAPVRTLADDAALLIYTSGTTGPPKGALIPHRALIGNLSGFVASQNWFPELRPLSTGKGGPAKGGVSSRPGPNLGETEHCVFWSPADWAWTGGLMNALLPTLYFGREIVACRGRFSAEAAFTLMQRHRVTHTFLFPTALKAMMKALPEPCRTYRLHLRAIMSAGEAVGDAVFGWCRDALGVQVNEMFGQTEMNYIVGNSHAKWPARPGSMGRPYPGHRVAVLDDHGRECARGTPGDVALHRLDVHGEPDPIFFLGYWNNQATTRAKFTGDADQASRQPQAVAAPRGDAQRLGRTGALPNSWCRTGDMAVMDGDGYLWYHGRSDDVFKAAGYRIGPSEIENCLVKHPAVANAAVVPKPDPERGALVKAYVVLAPGFAGDAALVKALQQHVRSQLAPYEYPKEIEFIAALPMTTTGKVQRRVLRLQEEERARLRAEGS